jgi:hypothetical protein
MRKNEQERDRLGIGGLMILVYILQDLLKIDSFLVSINVKTLSYIFFCDTYKF